MSPDRHPGENQGRTHRLPARLLVWAVCAVFFFCLFISLGTWQVQRLIWKQALIERVNARIHATPEAAPAPSAPFDAATAEYKPVALRGEFDHSKQALVQASTTLGAGFWVLTPLRTDAGWWVWVNRGFVPPPSQRGQQGINAPSGPQDLQGLLRLTEPKGGFLRSNDAAGDLWYSRDVAALSAARQLPVGQVAPYFVDAQANPTAKTVAEASIAVAEVRALSTEISLAAGSTLFELAGSQATLAEHGLDRHWRNARVHTLHDPVRWKYHAVGNYYLNGENPPLRGTI